MAGTQHDYMASMLVTNNWTSNELFVLFPFTEHVSVADTDMICSSVSKLFCQLLVTWVTSPLNHCMVFHVCISGGHIISN